MAKALLTYGIASVLLLAAFLLGRYTKDEAPVVTTDTLYVDRVLEKRDTVRFAVPEYRTIFKTQTDTVIKEIPVPVGTDAHGIITQNPIQIDRRNVTLTYWRPGELRWEQSVYALPEPRRWALYVDAGSGVVVGSPFADVRLQAKYGRLRGHIGYGADGESFGPTFGVRVDLIGWR